MAHARRSLADDAVDLTASPFRWHVKDGGGRNPDMVVSKDPEYGRNVGSYR